MPKKSYYLISWIPHLFLFYQEKVFRSLLPIMCVISLYETIIIVFFPHIARVDLGQFHLIFSFILTIIISFRVNTTFARWWEGRILWGALVNNSCNLSFRIATYFTATESLYLNQLVLSLPYIIKANLRKERESMLQIIESLGCKDAEKVDFPHLYVIQNIYQIINQFRDGTIDRMQQCALLESNIATIVDIAGSCERIVSTPMPPAFTFFIKQAILFYVLMFPFGWLDTFGLLTIPMMLMIVYILLGLEILAEELEQPFQKVHHGLKLDQICETIKNNLHQIQGVNDGDSSVRE